MADAGMADVPASPETQSLPVREQLDQEQISHDGPERSGDAVQAGESTHLGAVETEVTVNMPPVNGPADLVSGDDDDDIEAADEITPG